MSSPLASFHLDLEGIGFDQGASVLLRRALSQLPPGRPLRVRGGSAGFGDALQAWSRARGLAVQLDADGHAELAGQPTSGGGASGDALTDDAVLETPPSTWGLAARGARVEGGGPSFDFPLATKQEVWSDEAACLYRQGASAQWDPESAIPWLTPRTHPDEVEDAVVAIMTYLVESETAALVVPARFASQVHPYFREVMQVLALQAADEARHMEVFARRARLYGWPLGASTVSAQLSLKTLVEEPDFALASFLLAVLGEGNLLALLRFLALHGPDAVCQRVAHLAAQDEARHVAFGLSHLGRQLAHDPGLQERLAHAVERRHEALAETTPLDEGLFDALVVIAAGSVSPQAIAHGYDAVVSLIAEMDRGRRLRLRRLGFSPREAAALSALHTRNLM